MSGWLKWFCLGFVIWTGACAGADLLPMGKLYGQAAHNRLRNPVVLIHGMAGSRLELGQSGKIVWGAFTRESIDPSTPEGFQAIALPFWRFGDPAGPKSIAELSDDVLAKGPLKAMDISLLGLSFSVEIYRSILATLGIGGFRQAASFQGNQAVDYGSDHYTCFTFFYDWRKDNVTNALALGRFLRRTAIFVREQDARFGIQREQLRFDLVAHSMGGLIARYFLRYGDRDVCGSDDEPEVTWQGAELIDRLVLIGAPNLGSIEALRALLVGQQYSPFLPKFSPLIMGSFPSMYQLLPRPRQQPLMDRQNRPLDLDLYDVGVWLKNQWGVFAPGSRKDMARLVPNAENKFKRLRHFVQAALVRARRFHHALDKKTLTPSPVDIYLFASKSSLTAAQARVYWRNDLALLDFEDAELYLPGDQTVTFASAIGDERKAGDERMWVETPIDFRAVFLMDGNHLEMTRSRSFTNNLLHLLLSTKPPGSFFSGGKPGKYDSRGRGKRR